MIMEEITMVDNIMRVVIVLMLIGIFYWIWKLRDA